MALATLPLTATLVLGAGPDLLGLLVAAQSAAWLLVSLPAGTWIDRMPRRRMLIVALALGLTASIVAVAAAATGYVVLLGLAAIAGASGTVVYVLTSVSLLPSLVAPGDLPRSNARLELARAVVSLAAPFVAGLLAQHLSPTWGYALAALGAALALGPLGLDPAHMGLAQSTYGAGLILGALVAPFCARRLPPFATLIFGPAVSVVAASLFLTAPSGNGFALSAGGYFLVGFGPMLWLICQTTVRQLVTPSALMGRVNATVQTAIYGVRPLGALAGGLVAAQAGLPAALLLIAGAFVLSTLVIVLSPLARLRVLPAPATA
jgi:predicted MFS family arabinose efflux permease